MDYARVFAMPFATVYPFYLQKAGKKGRTKEEVDTVICWLTGYDAEGLQNQISGGASLEVFFEQAPCLNPNAVLIKGVICGYRVEKIENDLMRNIRYMDKLVDELAKGKSMDKILRK